LQSEMNKKIAPSTNEKGDCYCCLWETDPQIFIDQGVPEGYCGFCDTIVKGKVCGKPGHMRQGDFFPVGRSN